MHVNTASISDIFYVDACSHLCDSLYHHKIFIRFLANLQWSGNIVDNLPFSIAVFSCECLQLIKALSRSIVTLPVPIQSFDRKGIWPVKKTQIQVSVWSPRVSHLCGLLVLLLPTCQLRCIWGLLDTTTTFIYVIVNSLIDYCNTVRAGAQRTVTDKLQHVLNAATHAVTGAQKFDHGLGQILHDKLYWHPWLGVLQADRDSSLVSERWSHITIPVELLHSGHWCWHSVVSCFCQLSTSRNIALLAQYFWPLGFFDASPMDWNFLFGFILDLTISADCFRRFLTSISANVCGLYDTALHRVDHIALHAECAHSGDIWSTLLYRPSPVGYYNACWGSNFTWSVCCRHVIQTWLQQIQCIAHWRLPWKVRANEIPFTALLFSLNGVHPLRRYERQGKM